MIDNGVPLAASGLDVLRNRVVLELFRDLERYAPILQARFGPGVVVERGELVTLA